MSIVSNDNTYTPALHSHYHGEWSREDSELKIPIDEDHDIGFCAGQL